MTKRPWIVNALRALRPKQWTKNAVVFAAFIFALGDRQQEVDLSAFWLVLQAAITFCMVSSSIYLLNDIKDVEQDRQHPNKKLRPIAAGELSVGTAMESPWSSRSPDWHGQTTCPARFSM